MSAADTAAGHAPPIALSRFGRDDADEACRLFGEVYARREPLTVGVGQGADAFAAWMRGACPKAVDERLSIVARKADGGEPIGALIAEDGATPYAATLPGRGDDPIHALLSGLDVEYRAGRTVRPGEWLHLSLLVVDDSAAGQGVASRMIEACIGGAARRGWRLAYTEATHPGSQRAFARIGFETRLRRDYARWRFGGSVPFRTVAAQGGVLLMDRALDGSAARGARGA